MQFFFALTLFVSATLLFLVQPMFAKMVLPRLGGTAAVWNTCMVFYQAVLLAGYLYAHFSTKWLGSRRQALLHLVILALPLLVLPIALGDAQIPIGGQNPTAWLLAILAASVGLPFFAVSASAPMLQKWFADTGHPAGKDPYFLYAASNLGSMLALLGYPTIIEPMLPLAGQSRVWQFGYLLLGLLTVGCGAVLWLSRRGAAVAIAGVPGSIGVEAAFLGGAPARERTVPAPAWGQRIRWLALAFAPSSLLLGLTSFISVDLAAVPLLWVIPLALYLLTFVIVFAQWPTWPYRVMRRWLDDYCDRAREAMAVVPSTGLSRNPGEEPPEGGAANHALPSNPQSPIPNPEEWPEGRFANGRFPTAGGRLRVPAWETALKTFIHLLHPHWAAVWIQAILVAVLAACFYARSSESMLQFLLLHLATFFFTALVCHGELARSRPDAVHLTEFYIWMSLGGVLGGLFNAIVAPLVFNNVIEYPMVIALACMLRPTLWQPANPVRARWFDLVLPLWVWFLLKAIAKFVLPAGWITLGRVRLPGDLITWVAGVFILAATGLMAFTFRKAAARVAVILVVVILAALMGFEAGTRQGTDVIQVWQYLQRWGESLPKLGKFVPNARVAALAVGALLALVFSARPLRFGLTIGAILLAGQLWFDRENHLLHVERTFFGVLKVENDPAEKTHTLMHGSTIHGVQSTDKDLFLEPLTYYHRDGPLGRVFGLLPFNQRDLHIGVIGLGTGTTAAYAKKVDLLRKVAGRVVPMEFTQQFTYFEIDPAVKRIAEDPRYFTYLYNARREFGEDAGPDEPPAGGAVHGEENAQKSKIEIVLGDARLSLKEMAEKREKKEQETGKETPAGADPESRLDLLIVDAFSSDAIPIHLITKEAVQLYFRNLQPDGILMVHISNRYLHLEPVVGNVVRDLGFAARVGDDDEDQSSGKYASQWVAVAKTPAYLQDLTTDDDWTVIRPDDFVGVWTDDFSNILTVLTWVRKSHLGKQWMERANQRRIDRLGIEVSNLTDAKAGKLKVAGDEGVVVTQVQPGSPGDAAGLEKDMILTHVDGRRTSTIAECVEALADHPPGLDVTVAIRDHKDVIVRAVE